MNKKTTISKYQSCFKQNNDESFMLWIKIFIDTKKKHKKKIG